MNQAIKLTSIVTVDEAETQLSMSDILLVARADLTFTITISDLKDLISAGSHATRYTLDIENVDNTSDLLKPISNLTQAALNGKSNTDHTHAAIDHTHDINEVNDLDTALNGKSNTDHTHAFVAHGHSIADIGSLQTTLDNKSNIDHTHDSIRQTRDATADVIIHTSPVAYYPLNDESRKEVRAILGYHYFKEFSSTSSGPRIAGDFPIAPNGTWRSMMHATPSSGTELISQGMRALTEFSIVMGLKPNSSEVSNLQVLGDFTNHLLIIEGGRLGLIEKSSGTKEMMNYIMMVPSFCMILMTVSSIGTVTLKMGPNTTTLNMVMTGNKWLDKVFTTFIGSTQHMAIWERVIRDDEYSSIYKSFRNMEHVPKFSDLEGAPELSYGNRNKILTADSTGAGWEFVEPSSGTEAHAHPIAEVTGLQTALDDKSDDNHSHAISGTSGLQTALDGKANSSHDHSVTNVTGLQTALDGKAASNHTHTTGAHTHIIANTTGLQTALDGKAASNHTHTAVTHTHDISSVTGLQNALDSKTTSGHTHSISNVSALQGALDGKAPSSHSHSVSNTTGLQTALDGKADSNHTHSAGAHTHTIANTTGLQTALDDKAPLDHVHSRVTDQMETIAAYHQAAQYFPMDEVNYTKMYPTIGTRAGHFEIVGHNTPYLPNMQGAQGAIARDGEYQSLYSWRDGTQTPITHTGTKTFYVDFSVMMAVKINPSYSNTVMELIEFDDFIFTIKGLQIGITDKATGVNTVSGHTYGCAPSCYVGFSRQGTPGTINLYCDGNLISTSKKYPNAQNVISICNNYRGNIQHMSFYYRVLEWDSYVDQWMNFKGRGSHVIAASNSMSIFHSGALPSPATRPFYSEFLAETCMFSINALDHRVNCYIAPTHFTKILIRRVRVAIVDCGLTATQSCYTDGQVMSNGLNCGGETLTTVGTVRFGGNQKRGRICLDRTIKLLAGDRLIFTTDDANGLEDLSIQLLLFNKK